MRIMIPIFVDAPDDATHHFGDGEDMCFYKCKSIGVVGDHWFIWNIVEKRWVFLSHHEPHWIKKIEIDDNSSVLPFIGRRAFNCVANYAYGRSAQNPKQLSIKEFVDAMLRLSDEEILSWREAGKATLSKCREAQKILMRRIIK